LNISFIDIALIVVFIGVTILIVVKVVKKRKAKKDNQKLFDKWIKW
jgi:heme/copper-type cytochrome/quinol oxidase subunit 2